MNSSEIKSIDGQYTAPTYARFDLCLVEGKGCVAKDPEGREYLDFSSGIGVNSLGWCDPAWSEAVAGQAARLQHTSNLFYTEPSAQLAQALCERTGMRRVFFANSGAEANEGAIKIARKYSADKYGGHRGTIVSLVNSFHGRTLATLTATGQAQYHQHFHPFAPGFAYAQAGDIEALGAALTNDVCAVMLETIQGEGGVVPLPAAYLQAVEALCREKDLLLIVDEIQTGVGRTGKFLSSEHAGITPDIVTLAKGLGAGLPIGAVLTGPRCCETLGHGDHGSTFGANPVCCAGALVVMERMSDDFMAEVSQKGAQLKAGLAAVPGVAEVCGEGLMLGITLDAPLQASDVLQKAMAAGLLCLTAKSKLRLLPPLIITPEQIDKGVSILKNVIESLL